MCEDENKYHPDCCKKNNRWGQGPGKIYKEAYWYCPDTGQFVQKGLVSITDPTDAEKKD